MKHLYNQGYKTSFGLNVETELSLFGCYVSPVINYGSELWGLCKSTDLDKMHLHFCKQVLGVNNKTANFIVYNELGRLPLYIKTNVKVVKYWLKLLTTDNCILQQIYKDMVLNCNKYENWATKVKVFFDKIGMSYVGIDNMLPITMFFCQRSRFIFTRNVFFFFKNHPSVMYINI